MSNLDAFPSLEALRAEQKRLNHRRRYRRALSGTIAVLVVVSALAVLISTLFMPVFRITGSSMEPNLNDGDIIVAMKTQSFKRGQVCGFYYNNKLLLKERKELILLPQEQLQQVRLSKVVEQQRLQHQAEVV